MFFAYCRICPDNHLRKNWKPRIYMEINGVSGIFSGVNDLFTDILYCLESLVLGTSRVMVFCGVRFLGLQSVFFFSAMLTC